MAISRIGGEEAALLLGLNEAMTAENLRSCRAGELDDAKEFIGVVWGMKNFDILDVLRRRPESCTG